MSDVVRNERHRLSPGASGLAWIAARPRGGAMFCVVALTALGWLYLGVMQARQGDLTAVLCRPSAGAIEFSEALLVFAMWAAMTLAMMLPSAAPMILTYAEIAGAAARKGEPIVSPFILAAGYLAVWFAFAVIAAAVQIAATHLTLLEPGTGKLSALFSGALFIAAGAYQFTALKHACLRQCRAPFPFFFTNWATTPRGVLRLGVQQGFYCLGCCWAAMLVMFAFGVMNVLWMAALGAAMTIEKLVTGTRLTYAIGVVLIAAGVAFIALAGAGLG